MSVNGLKDEVTDWCDCLIGIISRIVALLIG